MRRFILPIRNLNIQTRLVVYYITFALFTVSVVIYFSYVQAVKSLQATVEDKLNVIAALKTENLNHWEDEQQRNAVFLANLPELRSLAGQLLNPMSPPTAKDIAHRQLTDLLKIIVQRTAYFQDIQILDLKGNVAVSLIPGLIGTSQADETYFKEGISKTFMQPFYESSALKTITLTVATPLFDISQKRVGMLALHLNMKQVDEIIRQNSGMNDSIQSYLITFDHKIITNDPILLASARNPEALAALSQFQNAEGIRSYTSLRGVPVIGKYTWLEGNRAALVVELDRRMAFWPARQLALNIALAGILFSLLLVFAVVYIARRITAPLRLLNETVSRISAGELDAFAPVTSDDEVGALARAFNAMTEKLQQTLAGLHAELRERKIAQDELLQFKKVMDESSDAIYLIDPETSRYLDFNRRGHEGLGYTREELCQLGVIDLAGHVETLADWKKRMELVDENGEIIFETTYRRKDGSIFPVEVSARRLEQEHRTILVGLVRDITERKNAEKALRESEERFRKVFQSSPVAICITTLAEGRLLDANYAYWDITGFDPQTSIGHDANELNMWDVPEERVEFVQNLKAQKSYFNSEDHFYRSDGTLKHVISFYELIHIGNEDCILAMFYDMSIQKQTMQALQESEARIRALLNAFPDMVIELTPEGKIIHVVPPKEMEYSMPPERFLGQDIDQIFSIEIRQQTIFFAKRTIETGQMNVFEFEMELQQRMHVFEARMVLSASNTLLMLIRDITQRKWVDAEREQLIGELEIKNRESETLRESLASIVGTTEFTEIAQRILKQIKRVIPYDTASIWTVDGNHQILITGVGLPSTLKIPGEVLTVDKENSAYPIFHGGLPYVLNNNVQEELSDFQMEPHTYVQSWLAIPLETRGKIIGLIALDGRQKDQFNEHHAALGVTFANQVAIALENASLFTNLQHELKNRRDLIAELENKNAVAETLRESAAIVVATLDKAVTIERILEQLERVVPFDSASVQLLNNNFLEIVRMRGFAVSENAGDNRFELNEDEPAYPIFHDNAPYILIDDVQVNFEAFAQPAHNRIRSWLAVPLEVRGKKLGVIALDGYQPGQFKQEHAQLAVTYASQVAIALENARLFSDLQAELTIRKNLISELENKNEELERFTYTVSHDLKSPLFTIRGFVGYLEQDALSGDHERVRGDIQRISEATDKMNRLLNELLELSRIGRIRNEPVVVPFEQIAREAVELVQGRIMEHGIAVHIEPNLPSVRGDYPRLVEVMQNLIDNAAKFMRDQPEPRIEIGQQVNAEGDIPILYVRDNGMGIAPEHFERVFNLFNKLDPKTDGTGIGLALVKRIIEVHGGRVWVESEVGRGTTFFFTLHQEDRGSYGG